MKDLLFAFLDAVALACGIDVRKNTLGKGLEVLYCSYLVDVKSALP